MKKVCNEVSDEFGRKNLMNGLSQDDLVNLV